MNTYTKHPGGGYRIEQRPIAVVEAKKAVAITAFFRHKKVELRGVKKDIRSFRALTKSQAFDIKNVAAAKTSRLRDGLRQQGNSGRTFRPKKLTNV